MNTQTNTPPIPHINWQPIEALPDDRMDGRNMILWKDDAPMVANYLDCWLDAVGRPIWGATHYADVEGPASCPGR